ncbi:hypothetical protein GCM10027589_12030 [Actinocorallia lasiicapitis]
MAGERYKMDVRPEIQLIEQVLRPLEKGDLRIPEFQRPFVWRSEQILDLFDSIERGYPIGTLLFWETDRRVPSLSRIGDLPAPPHPQEGRASYVLDGHQRLTALFSTLRRPTDAPSSREPQDWRWWPYRVLGEEAKEGNPYRHWKQAGPPPLNYLPMRVVMSTINFLRYARELQDGAPANWDVGRLINEAEAVSHRIMSYKLSVVRLVGGELEDAVEVFSRVNSTGQPMQPAQMVSALTYDDSGQQSLADRLQDMISLVADTGFGEVSSDTVFRAVLAITGEENVREARWDVLARRVKDKMQTAVADTEEALLKAISFLRREMGVPLARLIPYDAQLMLLTTFFHYLPDEPTDEQRAELRRWFWQTSWAGYFAGATSTQIRQNLAEMKDFAQGKSGLPWIGYLPRPFPDRFDLRSARVRAYLLWELQAFPSRIKVDGTRINAVELLAASPTTAYRQVVMRTGMQLASSPANRVILPTASRVSVRSALVDAEELFWDDLNSSHGIPEAAIFALTNGDEEGFIRIRQSYLAAKEREFMASLGITEVPGGTAEPDIDTE